MDRAKTDVFWQSIARLFVRAGFSPNQVTWLGLFLILGNCALYFVHQSSLWFGVGLIFAFSCDALDGAVARLRNMATKYGAYLDAVIDRYQEIAVYLVIAWVTDWWAVSFLALSGSMMVSYTKARAAMEVPIQNNNWPDLLERFERIVILCTSLVLDAVLVLPEFLGGRPLFAGLLIIGVLSHVTTLQRFHRARALILRDGEPRE